MRVCCASKHLGAFVAGLMATALLGFNFFYIPFIVLIFGFAVCLILKKFIPFKKLWLLFLAAAVGSLCFCFHAVFVYNPAIEFNSTSQRVVGTVAEMANYANKSNCYILRVSKIGDRQFFIPFNIKIYTKYEIDCDYGDEICAQMFLSSPSGESQPIIFNPNIAQCTYLQGKFESEDEIQTSRKFDVLVPFLRLRDRLESSICKTVRFPQNAVVNGILLGRKSQIPFSISRAIDRCGLGHIFSISGLHISIISTFFMFFFKLMNMSKINCIFGLGMCLVSFVAMAGFTPSAVRASIMAIASAAAILSGKKTDRLKNLLLSASIILFFSPTSAVGLSFLLSFSSCAGILLFSQKIEIWVRDRLGWFGKWGLALIELFSISVSATIGSAPFLILAFGKLSLISPLVNILFVPLVPVIFVLGAFAAFLGLFCYDIARFFGYLCEGLCAALLNVVKILSELPFCHIPANYGYAPFIVIGLVLGVLFAVCLKNKPATKSVAIICCANLALIPVCAHIITKSNAISVMVVGNGYGSSVVIDGDGKTIVINCGGGAHSGRRLCQFLDSKGIQNIDAFVFTSIKNKHVVGASEAIENLPVSCIILPESARYSILPKIASQKNIDFVFIDDLHIEISSASIDASSKSNSTVLSITIDGVNFVYSEKAQSVERTDDCGYVNVAILDGKFSKFPSNFSPDHILIIGNSEQSFENVHVAPQNAISEFVIQNGEMRKGGL